MAAAVLTESDTTVRVMRRTLAEFTGQYIQVHGATEDTIRVAYAHYTASMGDLRSTVAAILG
jgi:hypothetical protein